MEIKQCPLSVLARSHLESRAVREIGVSVPRQIPETLLRNMFPSPATSTLSFLHRVGVKSEGKKELLQWGENLEITGRDTQVTAWRWDFRTNRIEYAPHFREIFGFAPAEPVTYDTWTAHLDPRFREDALKSFAGFIEGSSRLYHDEQPYITAGGETHWVETRSLVDRNSQGKALKVTSICFDITQAKTFQQQLQESREFQPWLGRPLPHQLSSDLGAS